MANPSLRPLCVKFAKWPARDREAWIRGCRPGDPFDDPRPGANLRAESLKSITKAYGRWLEFLTAISALDPDSPPLDRVTPERLAAYARYLRDAGSADFTILSRFNHLAMAMSVMAPGRNAGWIRKPGGVTLHVLLRKRRRPMRAPDAGVLYQWACGLMDGARSSLPDRGALLQYRDGLLLAMLAARGRRLRSMTLLEVGAELLRDARGYRIELQPLQEKTKLLISTEI
jgi:hypothetical protein